MRKAELVYYCVFGKCDYGDECEWEVELTAEEERLYDDALKNGKDPNEADELQAALQRAYKQIEEEEIQNLLDMEDEYTLECLGLCEADPDEINERVQSGDAFTLKALGLEEAEEEELEDFDAYDLDELPAVRDVFEEFEPQSPFEAGWDLLVRFVIPDGEDEEADNEEED